MKATPETIWSVPAYLPYLQDALTDDAISEAERKIGYPLPEALLALLREQNGGYIRFCLEDSCHEQIYGIGCRFPSITDFCWSDAEEYVSFSLNGLVPFDGDGHWHLCLDYRKDSRTPAVVYVDVECDFEIQKAETFDEYLKLLIIEADERQFVLPSVDDLEALLFFLEKALTISFDPPDPEISGYPSYIGRLVKDPREWVNISPNLVKRGFVRKNYTRYEALHDRLSGNALRYPQLPAASYLLKVSHGLREELLSACQAESIEMRLLSEYVAV